MGGFGSGSWQSGRPTTSVCRSLAIRQLRRRSLLVPGLSFGWYWSIDGEPCGSIGIRTESEQLVLSYRFQPSGGDWQDVNTTVPLDFTPCNLGGRRSWFLCPRLRCGRRVAVLYLGSGGMFACRKCYGLSYQSQRESVGDRATRRADRLRERLGWEPGILNGDGDKPAGMHWRTFERLVRQHDDLVNLSMFMVTQRLGLEVC